MTNLKRGRGNATYIWDVYHPGASAILGYFIAMAALTIKHQRANAQIL